MTPAYKRLDQTPLHGQLQQQATRIQQPDRHLRHLLNDTGRLNTFSRSIPGIFFDFSRQRMDLQTLDLLLSVATELDLCKRFEAMCAGEKINTTEARAVLHTAARQFEGTTLELDGLNVTTEIERVRQEVKEFSAQIQNGTLCGSTGKRFTDIVVVGIGGSYLGTEFVANALAAYANPDMRLHYLANVDIHNFGVVVNATEPATTLWVVISKSYTTAETVANTQLVEHHLDQHGLRSEQHMVTVTAQGSPGDDPTNPVLQSFHMFDFIGGRYSVTSAVGAVPLSLYLGYDHFETFLRGAAEMDHHARATPIENNMPLLAALISVWNTTYLGYQQQAVIPYASPLAKLAPHVQQLNMESNGKSVDAQGQFLPEPAGTVIFGEPGTNAQHSFFQLAHQGRPFPIDFIGVLSPQYQEYTTLSKGVSNHQELWANMLAQSQALALGDENPEKPSRHFTGNRPSSTLVLEDLGPANVGRLLSFYEARTVYESFIWGINGFDQFGVQLGKTVASNLRREMALKNEQPQHRFEKLDEISTYYLNKLFKE